jgi:predicted XRE-type DNA-binding protein
MMAKKFRDLVRETLSEEEQAAAHAASRAMLLELNLREIREKVSELSQEEVAQLLAVTQPYISKLERQQDMLVSKLYDYVATLGGQVEIRAKFPDYDVVVRQFDDLATVMQVKDHRTTPGPGKRRLKDEVGRKRVAGAAKAATVRRRGTSRRSKSPKPA